MLACLLASQPANQPTSQPCQPSCLFACLLPVCYVIVFGVVYGHGFDVLGVMGSSPPGTFPVTHQQQLEAHIPQLVLSVCLWGVALFVDWLCWCWWVFVSMCVLVGGCCLLHCLAFTRNNHKWLTVVAHKHYSQTFEIIRHTQPTNPPRPQPPPTHQPRPPKPSLPPPCLPSDQPVCLLDCLLV